MVDVNVNDILNTANSQAAAALAPLSPLVNLLPLDPEAKEVMRTRPIDAFLRLFEPVEGFLRDVVTKANELSGTTSRTMINGAICDMRIDQPWDGIMSPSLRAFMRRLRTVNGYVVFVIQDPGHLAVATAQIFQARAIQGAQWLGRFISAVGGTARTQGPQAALAQAGVLLLTLLPGVAGLGFAPAVPVGAAGGATVFTVLTAAITTAGALTGTIVTAHVTVAMGLIKTRAEDMDRAEKAREFDVTHSGGGNLQDAVESSGIPGWAIGLGLLFGASLLVKK